MNWKLVDRILYYCYLKIYWKEKTTCHIFVIILTFVTKIKDIKTTGVRMLTLKMLINKLQKMFRIDIYLYLYGINSFRRTILSVSKLTQSVTLVGGWLVDNLFMCCYNLMCAAAHEWIELIRPVYTVGRDTKPRSTRFLLLFCFRYIYTSSTNKYLLYSVCCLLVNGCW
jgi:hypothetical protein